MRKFILKNTVINAVIKKSTMFCERKKSKVDRMVEKLLEVILKDSKEFAR